MRFILASASSTRRKLLAQAGLPAEVMVSGVDEELITDPDPARLALSLARLKAEAVAARLEGRTEWAVIGCDSVLEMDGQAHGKPPSPAAAAARWRRMRGATGRLLTGHWVLAASPGPDESHEPNELRAAGRTLATTVHFANPSDAEIDAYVASGEPLQCAGGFTIDGRGGAFVAGIEGCPSNVLGLSLPLLRDLLNEVSVPLHQHWH